MKLSLCQIRVCKKDEGRVSLRVPPSKRPHRRRSREVLRTQAGSGNALGFGVLVCSVSNLTIANGVIPMLNKVLWYQLHTPAELCS